MSVTPMGERMSMDVVHAVLRLEEVRKRDPNAVFVIERSTNANAVVFSANVHSNGQFVSSEPLRVYWINYETDKLGKNTAPLTFFEKSVAYGIKVVNACRDSPIVSLAGVPSVLMHLRRSSTTGHYTAVITRLSDKSQGILRGAYIKLGKHWTGVVPTVEYVVVATQDLDSECKPRIEAWERAADGTLTVKTTTATAR